MSTRKLLAGFALLAVFTAGCGVRASGVITGGAAPTGPAEGVGLYLVSNKRLTPVLRATRARLAPIETLNLLTSGPDTDEQAQGFTTEIPPGTRVLNVVSDASGVVVMVSADVATLSATAVDQIVCTVSGTPMTEVQVPGSGPLAVTLVGGQAGQTRGPRPCPV